MREHTNHLRTRTHTFSHTYAHTHTRTYAHAQGELFVRGSVAYVAQQPWIANATLRRNVCFDARVPFDEKRYRDTLEACALLPDLAVLKGGDQVRCDAGRAACVRACVHCVSVSVKGRMHTHAYEWCMRMHQYLWFAVAAAFFFCLWLSFTSIGFPSC